LKRQYWHRPSIKGDTFPCPRWITAGPALDQVPVLEQLGIDTEVHHHKVATAG
jgi:glutamine synthetase